MNLKKWAGKAVRFSMNLLVRLGAKPIVFLDSDLGQLDWLEISRADIYRNALWHLQPIQFLRIPLPAQPPTAEDMPGEHSHSIDVNASYRGVHLFSAIEYFLYISLEIPRHEFDAANRRHVAEASYWLRLAKSITDDLITYFNRHRPSVVVTYQGYFIEAVIARQLAGRFQYQVVALEHTFHSQRLIFEAISGIAVNRQSISSWINRFPIPSLKDDYTDPEKWLDRVAAQKIKDHKTPALTFTWPDRKNKILFLGQCFTDSSVLFGTDRPYSTIEIVRQLLQYIAEGDFFLFIKLHPKEHGGKNPLARPYDQLTFRKLLDARLVDDIPASPGPNYHVDRTNRFSTNQLIRDADVVVTINSQAGLEALALGREVILLGRAFYDQFGCTWNVPDLSILNACLNAILFQGQTLQNRENVSTFLRVYFEDFCIKKDAKSFFQALLNRRIAKKFFSPVD